MGSTWGSSGRVGHHGALPEGGCADDDGGHGPILHRSNAWHNLVISGAGWRAGPVGRSPPARSWPAPCWGWIRPGCPTRLLVRSGELFGISQGTTRVALSRMVAAGELRWWAAGHELAGHLLERQARQQASRAPTSTAVGRHVDDGRGGRRPPTGRGPGRAAQGDERPAHGRAARRRLDASGQPGGPLGRPGARPWSTPSASGSRTLARSARRGRRRAGGQLWDLDAWSTRGPPSCGSSSTRWWARSSPATPSALAPGFVLSAAVLRHLLADPLLPPELLPSDWSGDELRHDYDRYDARLQDAVARLVPPGPTIRPDVARRRRIEPAQLVEQRLVSGMAHPAALAAASGAA